MIRKKIFRFRVFVYYFDDVSLDDTILSKNVIIEMSLKGQSSMPPNNKLYKIPTHNMLKFTCCELLQQKVKKVILV